MLQTPFYKIGIVNYLNTQPLLFGLEKEKANLNMELFKDYPSKIGEMLLHNSIDIGLVPVALIPKIAEANIIGEYCIAANEAVASVGIFSQKPLEQLTRIILDYQSKTSVALTKILVKDYWKLDVEFVPASPHFINEIEGTTGALVIGDRALQLRHKLPYMYDLAEAWIAFTNLPFVFAAWVANKPIDAQFIKAFNQANSIGFSFLPEIVAANNYPYYDLYKYYTQNISYTLDEKKKMGLQHFLNLIP